MLYAIVARVTIYDRTTPGQTSFVCQSLPTFYLDSDVQGIVSADHAERIARGMLASLGHAAEDVYVAVGMVTSTDGLCAPTCVGASYSDELTMRLYGDNVTLLRGAWISMYEDMRPCGDRDRIGALLSDIGRVNRGAVAAREGR